MQGASFAARPVRTHHRFEPRTLTYVTLNEANGGIIRNVNHAGVAVQAVAPLRQQERVHLRFELRFPRLRIETWGQVSWADPSGQCGIRFVDLPPHSGHQINEWIFANLLEAAARDAGHARSLFGASVVSIARKEKFREEVVGDENNEEENDGLTVSPSARPAIRLQPGSGPEEGMHPIGEGYADPAEDPYAQSWLAQPLSGRSLAWLVDGLIVLAGVLLFSLIFLSIAHELPPWPLTVGAVSAAAVFVAVAYRTVFALFGGPSLGARLARATSSLDVREREEVENGPQLSVPR